MIDDLNADVAEGSGRFDTDVANGRRASPQLLMCNRPSGAEI